MAANSFNITLREGATYRTTFKWKTKKRVPIDLTDAVISAQIRDVADGNLLMELTPANGGLTITPLLGQIAMHITAAQTALINWSTAYWDLRVEFPNGDVVYPVVGRIKVKRSVTE